MTARLRLLPKPSVGTPDATILKTPEPKAQMASGPLSDAAVRRLKAPADVGKHADARGLYLLVTPSGGKSWRYDYRLHGKRRKVTFGRYPDVSLARAREKLQEARTLVADGIDPSTERKTAKREQRQKDTFASVTKEWQATLTLAPATARRHGILLGHLLPELGPMLVHRLTAADCLAVLKGLEGKGLTSTPRRCLQMLSQILRYAVATGRASRDLTTDLRGALAVERTTHHPAVTDPKAIGALLRAIDGYGGTETIQAMLRLAPLLFVRPGALRRMEWSEIDWEQKLWRIPAKKMKMGGEHLVPLAAQALTILEWQKQRKVGPWVFPSQRTHERPASEMAINAAFRRMGFSGSEVTAHGWRATARTILDERLRFQPDVIELQLGHSVSGSLKATYNRSRHIEERIRMMSAYADYLDTLKAQKS